MNAHAGNAVAIAITIIGPVVFTAVAVTIGYCVRRIRRREAR